MKSQCKWAFYMGLWHVECNSFLTTTIDGDLNYTFEEIPFDNVCPSCGGQIVETERKFGRGK